MKTDYLLMKLHAILGRDYWQHRMRVASDRRLQQLGSTLQRIQAKIKALDPSFGTLLPWQDGRDQKFILVGPEV